MSSWVKWPVLLLLTLVLSSCMPAMISTTESNRLLVYFDEFSADLSAEAQKTIADAAKMARDSGARGIRIEGRASATGSLVANKKLAETRTQVVADELLRDGVAPSILRQIPIGQTGSNDPTVAERRVDIVLEK